MNDPKQYSKWNQVQRRDVSEFLDGFKHKLTWRPDGQDTLIDVGCGTGDVTIDYIVPILPANFQRIIGIDKSEKMILHSKETHSRPNIEFKHFDIVTDNIEVLPKVDHITSFHCIHWIRDQKTAFQNIYELLKPGGDCLLLFIADFPIYHALKQMARDLRWAKYLKGIDRMFTPYFDSKTPDTDFEDILRECKFSRLHIELVDVHFEFDGIDQLRNILKGVLPFFDIIPESDHSEYIDECARTIIHLFVDSTKDTDYYNDRKIRTPYRNIVAYIQK